MTARKGTDFNFTAQEKAVTRSSEKREMAVALAASQAMIKTVFCIKENREEGAEKTPSTCSNNQGNQHFSHPVYCDTRINKI